MSLDIQAINAIAEDAVTWRHKIHQNPELAFEEFETASFVKLVLEDANIKVTANFAGTGVIGTLTKGKGPTIALRADMDALPLQEETGLTYSSKNKGKMHACGHDGHTSMLLAAATYLSKHGNFKGTIHFIFQPAEENEAGARAMIEAGLFEKFPVDAVYGMHNWPELPPGTIAAKSGPQMAAFDTFEITVTGKGCHAAMPHLGRDPILAACQIVTSLQSVTRFAAPPTETAVVSVTQIIGGDTWNAIPDDVVIRGCTRHFTAQVQTNIENWIGGICGNISAAYEVNASLNYEKRYPAVINSVRETKIALEVAALINAPDMIQSKFSPSMASEDFAFMLQEVPGCYIWMGNGEGKGGCMLHNPRYDFNDDIIQKGMSYWIKLTEKCLPV